MQAGADGIGPVLGLRAQRLRTVRATAAGNYDSQRVFVTVPFFSPAFEPCPSATHLRLRLDTEPTPFDGDDASGASQLPSKTALKKAMHELQELGEALLTLPDDRIDAIGLPESLRDAVRTAQRTKSHEGRRRQMQYLGKLMRRTDAAEGVQSIRDAVASFQLGHAKDALALHATERWRAELIASDDALRRWADAHPRSDMQQLRSLVRNARKEAAAAAPAVPGSAPRQSRAYRELFKFLRGMQAEESHGA